MISLFQSMLNLTAAAAMSAGMVGAGVGAIGRAAGRRRAAVRPVWLVGGVAGAAMTFAVAQRELDGLVATYGGATAWAVGLAVAVVAGVTLFVVGTRGRFVGDHEHCRRCGFDLFGRPGDARVCSECGSPLDARRAIVIGVRRRRPVPLLAGAFLVVLGVAIAGVIARDTFLRPGGFVAIRYKPTAWLIDDVASGKPARAFEPESTSLEELNRRSTARELSAADGRRLVAAATAAGPGSPLHMLALNAWGGNLVDEATMRAYLLARARPTVTFESTAWPKFVPYRVGMDGLQESMTMNFAGRAPTQVWSVAVRDRADTINGVPVDPGEIEGVATGATASWVRHDGWEPFGYHFGTAFRPAKPLPAGPAVVRIRMTATVTLNVLGASPLVVDLPIDATGRPTVVVLDRLPSAGPPDARMGRLKATLMFAKSPPLRAVGPASRASHALLEVSPPAAMDGIFVGDVYARDAATNVERRLGAIELFGGRGMVATAETVPADATLVFRPEPGGSTRCSCLSRRTSTRSRSRRGGSGVARAALKVIASECRLAASLLTPARKREQARGSKARGNSSRFDRAMDAYGSAGERAG